MRWRTFLSIPASWGLSACSAERPIFPSPSARKVPRWRSLWPIWLRVCVIFSFAIGCLLGRRRGLFGTRQRRFSCNRPELGGLSRSFLLCRDREDLRDGQAARLRDLLGPPQPPHAAARCLEHLDRGGRPQALREDG